MKSATRTGTARQTFKKLERLSSRKLIAELMADGKVIHQSPFRAIWQVQSLSGPFPVQIAFSVPRRIFRRAVDRNRIKRLIRESYRKNKADIYTLLKDRNVQIAVLIVYSGKMIPDYQETEQKIQSILKRLVKANQ